MFKQSTFLALAVFSLAGPLAANAAPMGTAFAYHGRLTEGGNPANGTYDMEFSVFDSLAFGNPIGNTYRRYGTAVSNGLFTVVLDFGANVFTGDARWLSTSVRTNNGGSFTPLTPLQPLTPTPYALFATTVTGAGIQDATVTGAKLAVPLTISGSTASGTAILSGINGAGNGMAGTSTGGRGLYGKTAAAGPTIAGVYGENSAAGGTAVVGTALNVDSAGVAGVADGAGGTGVYGAGATNGVVGRTGGGTGVRGTSFSGDGTFGISTSGTGVQGASASGWGVYGHSQGNAGVFGQTFANAQAGVLGRNDGPTGVGGQAVFGYAHTGAIGVHGISEAGDGVVGESHGAAKTGVVGLSSSATGYGGYFYNTGGGVALHVNGSAEVLCLTILGGCDVAEPFHMSSKEIPKGAVVVIDDENAGQLKLSDRAYDSRVAGIVSGANGINSGISLHQEGVLEGGQNVALSGRVYVLADSSSGAIKPGDLLTSSNTPGHAMKVSEHAKAQGAILGKAMSSLKEGKGMVLVLVTLQ